MLKAKLAVRKKYKKKLVKIIGGENILSCLLNGQRINCFDGKYNKDQLKKWSSKKILLCPVCGKPYEYCHGKVVQPYFRHKDKAQCEDKYSEPETEEHLQGKRDLYEWIKRQDNVTDVILEGWIPETKQRPDIMFKYKGEQCVLEFQCSPISTEYYERHELYQAAGINDYWICGTQKYFGENKRFNTLEKECGIYYNPNNKLMYCNLNMLDVFINNSNIYHKLKYLYKDNINKTCLINFYSGKENLNTISFSNKITFNELNNEIVENIKSLKKENEREEKEKFFEENIESFYDFFVSNKCKLEEIINNLNNNFNKYNLYIKFDNDQFIKEKRNHWIILKVYYVYKDNEYALDRLNLYSKYIYKNVNDVFFTKDIDKISLFIIDYYNRFLNLYLNNYKIRFFEDFAKYLYDEFYNKYKKLKYFNISLYKLNESDDLKLSFCFNDLDNMNMSYNYCNLILYDKYFNYIKLYYGMNKYKQVEINEETNFKQIYKSFEIYQNQVLNDYINNYLIPEKGIKI